MSLAGGFNAFQNDGFSLRSTCNIKHSHHGSDHICSEEYLDPVNLGDNFSLTKLTRKYNASIRLYQNASLVLHVPKFNRNAVLLSSSRIYMGWFHKFCIKMNDRIESAHYTNSKLWMFWFRLAPKFYLKLYFEKKNSNKFNELIRLLLD